MAEEKQNPSEIHFNVNILSAKLISFEITPRGDELNLPQQDKYEYNISPSFKMTNTNEIEVIVHVKILQIDTKDELGSIKTHFFYSVNDLDGVIKTEPDKNTIEVPPSMIATVVGISISTTRGMLIMCTTNTMLSTAIIPPIPLRLDNQFEFIVANPR